MAYGPTIRLDTKPPSFPARAPRPGHWTEAKAVTFIVTLAAHRSVTLAAARAGMSRKAAYALRARDPAFAAAWDAAWSAGASRPAEGDEGDEVHNPPVAPPAGNTMRKRFDRASDALLRDRYFADAMIRALIHRTSPSP